MVVAYIRSVYRQQQQLIAQRAVQNSVDAAVTQSIADATGGIS